MQPLQLGASRHPAATLPCGSSRATATATATATGSACSPHRCPPSLRQMSLPLATASAAPRASCGRHLRGRGNGSRSWPAQHHRHHQQGRSHHRRPRGLAHQFGARDGLVDGAPRGRAGGARAGAWRPALVLASRKVSALLQPGLMSATGTADDAASADGVARRTLRQVDLATKLREEAQSPFRTFRMFIYSGLVAAATIATATTIPRIIGSAFGAPNADPLLTVRARMDRASRGVERALTAAPRGFCAGDARHGHQLGRRRLLRVPVPARQGAAPDGRAVGAWPPWEGAVERCCSCPAAPKLLLLLLPAAAAESDGVAVDAH
eukprot:scaffold4781_cov339-Prasinococcus_capsulatus_cf.AAC.16